MTAEPDYGTDRRHRRYISTAGGPQYVVMGPAVCKGCGVLVWYAHSHTRLGWSGPIVKGYLRWREKGGRIHKCDPTASKRRQVVRW